MGKRIIMALSGGLDSATLLAYLKFEQYMVSCIGFTYGSKHNSYENKAASDIADFYKVPYQLIDLTSIFSSFTSSLMKDGADIPEGHYSDSSMSSTVVPSRNIIFSSILSGLAWSQGISQIALGVHSGDHAIYPDCRPGFIKAIDTALFLGTDGKVEIIAPFLNMNKQEIVKIGLHLGVPYHLTRTCYKDQEIACGVCGSCYERQEAFTLNGTQDPIIYEER